MSHKHCREEVKVNSSKNLAVVSKCLAIVLIPKTRGSSGNIFENDEVDETVVDSVDGNIIQSSEVRKALSPSGYSGKELLQDFKIRNKTCYWNPSLVESIKNLEFKGFVEPCTILVTGEDIHLENLRSAWARRVLKAPAGFVIERIGDVNGIEMQVIPQTQFIPLPDAVCSIIMDLNMRRIVATMEVIWEKLSVWYKQMTVPSQQLLFDILGSLIRDRKVFHTGSGYFVVTPDTNRLQNGGGSGYHPTNASWLPYHPMYVPVFQGQVGQQLPLLPSRAHMRSISCQVTTIEESSEEDTAKERKKDHDKLGRAGFDTKSSRSDSLKRRDGKDDIKTSKVVKRDNKVVAKEMGDFRRSSSLKVKGEKAKVAEEINLKPNNVNQEKEKREKTSIFSRLFSRKKKHKDKDKALMPPPPPPPPLVSSHITASSCETLSEGKGEKEYGTFSAQFPPPEWVWYHQQLERQKRTETWISQQDTKSVNPAQPPKVITRPPASVKHSTLNEHPEQMPGKSGKLVNSQQIDYMAMRVAGNQKDKVFTNNEVVKQVYDGEFVKPPQIRPDNLYESFRNPSGAKHRHHHRKSREFERPDEDKKHHQAPSDYAVIDQGDTTLYHDSNVYHSVSALSPVAHLSDESTYAKLVERPKLGPLHSTPRCEAQSDRASSRADGHELRDRIYGPPGDSHKRKSHRTRRRPHRAYSCYDGHGDDISYEYHGRLPNKNSSRAQSRDSGVNCIGQAVADDQDKRQHCPVYENTSSKHLHQLHHGSHHQNRNSHHPHSNGNHVRFEINNTTANDTTNVNVMYLTDCNINSLTYQSDVTNPAYNSVVYGSNVINPAYNSVVYGTDVTDMVGGPSVVYHTITSSHLDSSEMPLPQNSLQSAIYNESCLDLTPSNAITCKAEINPKGSQDVVELHGSPETIIVDVLSSSTEQEVSSPSCFVQHVVSKEKLVEEASKSGESNKYENRQKKAEDAASTDYCDKNVHKASDVDCCVSNNGKESEQEYEKDYQQSPFVECRSSEGMYSQSAFVPTVTTRQDVISGNDNFVSDSGFSSPRNPQKPSDRRAQTSNISNSTSENSDGVCHQESSIYPQHLHQNIDSSNSNYCSTNGSNNQHTNSDHQSGSTNENGDPNNGTALEQENSKQAILQKFQPRVKQSSSLNSIKSHNHVQLSEPLSQLHQSAAKIVPHPDIYNSNTNIMYTEPNRPARVPLYSQSLNHQKPLQKHQKRERPHSVDLWKSNTPTDLHKFEEEQLSKKYGANGEFEVMGVL